MNRRAIGLVGSLLIFLALLYDAMGRYDLATVDMAILSNLRGQWSDGLNSIILFITDLSGHVAVPLFGICLLVYLCFRRDWHNVAFSFSALMGGLILFTVFKTWVGRARPESMLYDPGHYSFPSGHAAMSTLMALIVYFIFRPKINQLRHTQFLSLCLLFPLLISFTRVFLNVHYPTDVIGGMALSFIWIILLSYIYHTK